MSCWRGTAIARFSTSPRATTSAATISVRCSRYIVPSPREPLASLPQVADHPIGECWLQEMNLERILRQHPGRNCRRIDLMIGEKDYRGRGLGTEMIGLLTALAFEQGADMVFGCDIADYN